MRTIRSLLLLLVLLPLSATTASKFTNESSLVPGYLPLVSTNVATQTVYLDKLYLANKHTVAVTVLLQDRTNRCAAPHYGAGNCQILPTISIPAQSVYVVDLADIPAIDGFTWKASVASVVVGWVHYRW